MIHKSNFIPEPQTITKRGQIAHSKWLEDNTEPKKPKNIWDASKLFKDSPYQTALKRYNERRFKWKGFHVEEKEFDRPAGKVIAYEIFSEDLCIEMNDEYIHLWSNDDNKTVFDLYFDSPIPEHLFESICKAFNINLETT